MNNYNFLKDMDSKDDSVRYIVKLAAFLGANIVAVNICKSMMPFNYRSFRRLLYSFGGGCLSVGLANIAADEATTMYDSLMGLIKKYNSSNEEENSDEEKEVMVNEEDLG